MVYSAALSVIGEPSHFGGTLRQRCCQTSDPILLTTHQGLRIKRARSNERSGCWRVSSMTLFLVAIVVLAAGLLGTLVLLFRDAHRGTKGLKRFLLSNWK